MLFWFTLTALIFLDATIFSKKKALINFQYTTSPSPNRQIPIE